MMAKIIRVCHYARKGWAAWHKWVFATSGLAGENFENGNSLLKPSWEPYCFLVF
jgi:hypothetical protein